MYNSKQKNSWLFLFADLPTVEDLGDLCADTLLPLCRHFACHFLQLWVPLASTWTFNQFGSSLFSQSGDVSKPIFQPSWGVLHINPSELGMKSTGLVLQPGRHGSPPQRSNQSGAQLSGERCWLVMGGVREPSRLGGSSQHSW